MRRIYRKGIVFCVLAALLLQFGICALADDTAASAQEAVVTADAGTGSTDQTEQTAETPQPETTPATTEQPDASQSGQNQPDPDDGTDTDPGDSGEEITVPTFSLKAEPEKRPESGASADFELVLVNQGSEALSNTVLTLWSEDGGVSLENPEPVLDENGEVMTGVFRLGTLEPGKEYKIPVTLTLSRELKTTETQLPAKALCSFSLDDRSCNCKLDWNLVLPDDDSEDDETYYYGSSGSGTTTSSVTPYILVRTCSYGAGDGTGVEAGTAFQLKMKLQNTSTKLNTDGVYVTAETSEGLAFAGSTNTCYVGEIAANGTADTTLSLKALDSCAGEAQTVTLTFHYEYVENSERKTGTTTEVIPVSVAVNGAVSVKDAVTPYIMVESYDYGEKIGLGDSFVLSATFSNTSSKIDADGVMVTIETSEGLAIDGESNTLYIGDLAAGEKTDQTLKLRVLPNSTEAASRVTLTIKYEYLENHERKQGERTEILYVNVSGSETLELGNAKADPMYALQEGAVSVSYVNKGRGTLYNLEAQIALSNAQASESMVYTGNVEAGKTGSLDFIVTPDQAGTCSGTITVSYQNAAGQTFTEDIPVSFSAGEEEVDETEYYDDLYTEEASGSSALIPILIASGAVLAVVVILLLRWRKKQKQAAEAAEADDDDWDDREDL